MFVYWLVLLRFVATYPFGLILLVRKALVMGRLFL